MPISQYALQAIANPMSQGIGSISTALSQIKQSKHEEALNAIRTQELDMKVESHKQSTELNKLKMQEQLGKTALMSAQYQDAYANAYVKAIRKDPTIMQDPLRRLQLQRQLAEGKPVPAYLSEDLLDPQHIMQMQEGARQTIQQFASDEKREMWQERDRLARSIQAGTASEADKAAFEAMRPAPLVSVNQPGPGGQGWSASYDIFQSLTDPEGDDLKGNVEGEDAFITTLDSRAKLISEQSEAMAKQAKDPSLAISYDAAVMKAKEDLMAEGKLKKNESWIPDWKRMPDIVRGGLEFVEDWARHKWEFDPEGKPEAAEPEPQAETQTGADDTQTGAGATITEEYITQVLKHNNVENTEANRRAVIEQWLQKQK